MTLPASQQHALDAIDDVLQSDEPQLATMFGVFTDLTHQEGMPAVETLPPGPWWARYAGWARYGPGRHYRPGRPPGPPGQRAGWLGRTVLVPLLLIAAVSLLIVSVVSAGPAGRGGCGQVVVSAMAARLRTTASGTTGPGGPGGPGGPACHAARTQTAGRSR
jgi:hypothetical protein